MNKYTANYAYTNPNFVIQNLEHRESIPDLLPLLYVVKNILQRGFPTVMSKFLQSKIGKIHEKEAFYNKRLLLVPRSAPKWYGTIKGDTDGQYNPAKDFLEHILPSELGDYSFVQSMILPEVKINDIVESDNPSFVNQQVDFYLPQALLVIEIDGAQHHSLEQAALDQKRDKHLAEFDIKTIRITTKELQTSNYYDKITDIKNRLKQFPGIKYYREAFDKVANGAFSEEEIQEKLLPTAIIRFQILFLELLINGYIKIGESWKFNIKCEEPVKDFARFAIEDVYVWLNHLTMLRDKHELTKFNYSIKLCNTGTFKFDRDAINIDFSLLQRYTDENKFNPSIIYVRTDYFDCSEERIRKGEGVGIDRNYFKVSTDKSINYHITDSDKPTLRFFLQNLFNKNDFREGQFAIIANALNLNDTIGLLPTGGGKSLCFQLPCLLQPSINFVVCPIKSLMYDQIDNLKQKDVKITNVNLLCGDQRSKERDRIMSYYSQGKYLFMWISPERFQIIDFRRNLQTVIQDFNVSYAVIDEVHCMSEWGHDFRTSYLNLTKTIDSISFKDEKIGDGNIKFIGLTATASVNVLKDIKIEFARREQQFEDDNIKTLLDYTRPELDFYVINDQHNKPRTLVNLIDQENILNKPNEAVLVFTPHVNGPKGCVEVNTLLKNQFPEAKIAYYSGEVPHSPGQKMDIMPPKQYDEYKRKTQEKFKNNQYQILCTTKAFGMGIDKQNIFYTFHYGLPGSVETLYQEAGRAGRWDKSLKENREKRGKCFVLHSRETPDVERYANEIFQPSVSIKTMLSIIEKVKWDGKDIFTQLFLLKQNMIDPDDEFNNIINIIDAFFVEGETQTILYKDFQHKDKNQLNLTSDVFEKEIYRLSLLGIVDDWTRDFINSFTVKFNTLDTKHIIESLTNYIQKYDPDEKVESNINLVKEEKCDTFLKKAVWYLLDWILRHITENRKQSLKTLSDWCLQYTDSESFKHRIEAYFTFTESTYILQHIAEHSDDYDKWFDVFYNNKKFITKPEINKLRDRLSRFLESYHNSPGLNFVSGIVRLLLDDFEDPDGRMRMESALRVVADTHLSNMTENAFIIRLFPFIKDANFSDEQCCTICIIIIEFFPALLDKIAEEFKMPWLYNDTIKKNIKQLNNLNKILYESIGRF